MTTEVKIIYGVPPSTREIVVIFLYYSVTVLSSTISVLPMKHKIVSYF